MDSAMDDILIEIFLRINDAKSLAQCAATCCRWANILSSDSSFWLTKCKFNKRSVPTALISGNAREYSKKIDCRRIWLKNPYGRNLIKNDSGQNGFANWTIEPDRWAVNQIIHGGGAMIPIEKPPGIAHAEIECCFVTSHFECTKTQVVDLVAEGAEEWILDQIKPAIAVSEWHAHRQDCGSIYRTDIALLDSNKEIMGTNYETQCMVKQWEGGNWGKTLHRFTNYPAGVRYVDFTSAGRDIQFWRGFFGAKMAKASVTLEFS